MKNFQFGTDGIRGQYGVFPITDEAIYHLTYALIEWFQKQRIKTITLMVARDTRLSSEAIYHAIIKAAQIKGARVLDLGIAPTPALAWLMQRQIKTAHVGLMITASHNPWQDNGIKLFTQSGRKFSVEQERELSEFINRCQISITDQVVQKSVSLEYVQDVRALLSHYQEYVVAVYQNYLEINIQKQWRIVVDTANGALYQLAYQVLEQLGHKIFALGNTPNGYNINEYCGATYAKTMAEEVIHRKADLGVCFDGDGDRVILCDSQGRVIDGDGVLFFLVSLFGCEQQGIVGTQMTNGFVEKRLRQLNIPFIRTPVGDKYIAEALETNGWRLGGESSGHILLPEHNPCGDGLLAFMVVLAVLTNRAVAIQEILKDFSPYPQKLVSLAVKDKDIVHKTMVQEKIKALKEAYPNVVILVRPSGTESVIRIMVESEHSTTNDTLCEQIVSLLVSSE